MKAHTLILFTLIAMTGCNVFTSREREIIDKQDSLMKVYVMPEDSTILRAKSTDLSPEELKSARLKTLLDKMLYTVTDPSQDGVGIAAPQVGINRRIILVQRLDKEGEPFQAYVNVRIDSLFGPCVAGQEGCLSVPGYRGTVVRSNGVVISYADIETGERLSEQVEGFTARIFQHECDHLDGIIYTDRADSLEVRQ